MGKLTHIDGLPVTDATRSLELHITARDIAHADNKNPEDCVAARACRRQFHAKEARIHLGRTYIRLNDNNWIRLRTPKPLRDEIIAFDRGGKFEPGDFLLSPVVPADRLGNNKRNRKPPVKVAGPRPKKRRPAHIVTNVRNGPV
jgi:hypothetical protein